MAATDNTNWTCASAEPRPPGRHGATRLPEGGGPDSQQPPGGLSCEVHGAARDVRGPGNALAGASHRDHTTGTADHDGSARGHVPVARSFRGRRIGGLGGLPTVRKKLGQTLLRQVWYASQDVAQIRRIIGSSVFWCEHPGVCGPSYWARAVFPGIRTYPRKIRIIGVSSSDEE